MTIERNAREPRTAPITAPVGIFEVVEPPAEADEGGGSEVTVDCAVEVAGCVMVCVVRAVPVRGGGSWLGLSVAFGLMTREVWEDGGVPAGARVV